MSYHPEFATLLDQHLAAQERSGAWLAQRLGRHPATVTRWRTGESLPGQPEMLQQVADLLGIHGAERQRLFLAAGYALLDAPGADAPPVRDTPPQSSPPETPTGQHAAAPTSNEPKGAPLDPPPAAADGRVSTKLLGSRYPTTYRQAEVATLQRWIELGASGLVLGLAGAALRGASARAKAPASD